MAEICGLCADTKSVNGEHGDFPCPACSPRLPPSDFRAGQQSILDMLRDGDDDVLDAFLGQEPDLREIAYDIASAIEASIKKNR